MMQSDLLLPYWPTFNFTSSILNHDIPYDPEEMDFCAVDESPMISSNSYVPTMFPDMFLDLQNLGDEIQISSIMEELENISSGEIEEICEWINNNNNTQGNCSSPITIQGEDWSPCLSLESSQNSTQFPVTNISLVLPGDEMEVDKQLSLLHLLRAYGEAMENRATELTEVIVKSINEKSNPLGNTVERVAYNLFQSSENQGEYLKQQSSKNFLAAFQVFYQSLPYGRFAHFTANSAILESMPHDAPIIHIVDFDLGEGIQWPPVIEALSRKQKALRLTSVKIEGECKSCYWEFEETKKRLENHAREYGVKLLIEERGIEDFVNELTKRNERGQGRDWLVFNCMVGLAHLGRRRPRNQVNEFLKVAKKLLDNFAGIAILGDGEAGESLFTCSSYSSFFELLLRHYQALFESLEMNFPVYLAEARTALESLFLAPFMCSVAWSQDWEEMTKCYNIRAETRLKGRKISQESLAEAKQMVNERENSYEVKIEGLNKHEMVLQWKETPLVRVSTWM